MNESEVAFNNAMTTTRTRHERMMVRSGAGLVGSTSFAIAALVTIAEGFAAGNDPFIRPLAALAAMYIAGVSIRCLITATIGYWKTLS